jgi:signal transduction histidine kinase
MICRSASGRSFPGASDALGGTLQIASSPGNGTTLRMILPVSAALAVGGQF